MSFTRMTRYLELDEVVRTQSFGPIAIGTSLGEIGSMLHAPRYWGFGVEEQLLFYAGFGGVEVHFRSEGDMPRVFYAELDLSGFKNDVERFLDTYEGGRLRIRNNLPRGGNEFEAAKSFFKEKGIPFTTSTTQKVMDETAAILNFGRVQFFYRNRECPVLDLITLS